MYHSILNIHVYTRTDMRTSDYSNSFASRIKKSHCLYSEVMTFLEKLGTKVELHYSGIPHFNSPCPLYTKYFYYIYPLDVG